jgi:hypothetical protein
MRAKRKIGTVLDEGLYRRTRLLAAAKGKQISQILSEALTQYLESHDTSIPRGSIAADTFGALSLAPEQVRTIVEEEDGFLGA